MNEAINPTRYRALWSGLLFMAACALGGAFLVALPPAASVYESWAFVAGTVVTMVLFALTVRARREGDRAALERLSQGAVVLGAALLVQRIGWEWYGPSIDDATHSLFRVSLAFLPLLYLAALTVLRTRVALQLCWVIWAVVIALAIPALWIHTGFDLARPGMGAVMVWLLFANPLFLLMLHAQPQYERQIERGAAELARVREQAQLVEKLSETERRFNLVVQSLEVGVWDRWFGPPERRWWSPRFYELLGYTPDELPATEDHLKALLHPEDRDAVWKQGTEQLRKGDIMDVDFRLKTKRRGYRWFNSHAKADRDETGKMVRMAGSITDIHERRTQDEALRMAQTELTRLAYRDTLTDQYNRRYFDEHFQREWDRARRTREPLALLIIDLDYFKAYNDRYGHPLGDRCLVQVAQVLARAASRSADIVARLGGEEFGVVLPGTSAAGAEEVAHRIRQQLREAAIAHEGAPSKVITVSIGIASIEAPDGPAPAEIMEQADKALYEVKRRGRDGVMTHGGARITATGEHTVEITGRYTIHPLAAGAGAVKPEERLGE